MTALKNRNVKGVPGLSVIKLPLYIPKDVVDTLPEPSISPSSNEIKSVVDAKYADNEPISSALFDSLRETNTIHQLSQAQALRSVRASYEADLENLDAEIQRLHSKISDLALALSELTAKRIRTQDLSSLCSSWLSPLRRLPPEILGEIFTRCLPSHGRPVATEAPLLLTRICSTWRRTALGLPLLWTHLFLRSIAIPNRDNTSLKMSKIMEFWFDHGSNSPLTFHLYHKYNDEGGERDKNIGNVMIKHAGRFRRLHVSSMLIHGFMTHTPGRFKILESLQLEIGDFDIPDLIITVFDKAPLLREVILNIKVLNLLTAQLILPWKQLTNLSVVGTAIYQVDMLYMLRACEQLVSGSFAIKIGEGDGEIAHVFSADLIVLEFLVDFKVSLFLPWRNFEGQFVALDKLSLPMLTHFLVMGDRKKYTDLSNISLLGALRRAPKLQHVTLLDFDITRQDLPPILQSIPRLTFLKLAFNLASNYRYLIDALRYADNQSSINAPLLESLDIRIKSVFIGLDMSELMVMVRSRQITRVEVPRQSVAYLNLHLHLYGRHEQLEPEIMILNDAQAKGEIELSTYDSDDDDDNYDESISLDLL